MNKYRIVFTYMSGRRKLYGQYTVDAWSRNAALKAFSHKMNHHRDWEIIQVWMLTH